jgi:hypothetical protein
MQQSSTAHAKPDRPDLGGHSTSLGRGNRFFSVSDAAMEIGRDILTCCAQVSSRMTAATAERIVVQSAQSLYSDRAG